VLRLSLLASCQPAVQAQLVATSCNNFAVLAAFERPVMFGVNALQLCQ
jgi:hypothetical protein